MRLYVNKLFLALAAAMISFFTYGFYISQFEFNFIKPTEKKEITLFYDYKIGLNIYSDFSSGSGTANSISEEARKAQLQYILISDYNTFFDLEPDSKVNGINLLRGIRLSDEFRKFSFYESSSIKNYNQKNLLDFLNNENALIIEHHPLNKNFQLQHLENFKFDGLEVVNFKSITQKAWKKSKLSTIWSLLYYPFNPRLALIRLFQEPKEEFEVFDKLSLKKRIALFYGAEATARAIPFADWLIKFPSYESSFIIGSQHLLTTQEIKSNLIDENKLVVSLLKKGQSYISFDALGDPKGFQVYVQQSEKIFFNFDQINFKDGTKIYYELPAEPTAFYEVVLYRNGQKIDHFNTFKGQFLITQPGVYRVVVRISPNFPLPDAIKWIPWIYTNNFYIGTDY